MNASWIATRTLLAVRPDGQELPVTLRMGVPYEISPEEWACPVALDGLQERLPDMHGIDAWQSIQLVQTLQAQLLRHFIEEGGKLCWPETLEPVELHELFPRVRGE